MRKIVLFTIIAIMAAKIALAGALVRTPGGGAAGVPEGGKAASAILPLDFWGRLEDKPEYFEAGAEIMMPKFTVKDKLGRQYSKNIGHVLPWMNYAGKRDEQLAWGVNLYTPFGLGTSLGKNREQLGFDTQSLISRTDIMPGLDVWLTNDWRLSAGLILSFPMVIYKAPFDLNRHPLPVYTNNRALGFGAGWALAVFYEPSDRFRLGLEYDSEITAKLDGRSKISAGPFVVRDDFNADLEFPASWKLAFRAKLTGRLEAVGDLGFFSYSKTANDVVLEFDKLMIHKPLKLKWQDTWACHTGFNYRLNKRWSARTGLGWLSQGVPDETTDTLTLDVPGWDTALGVSCQLNDNSSVNLSWTRAWGNNEVKKGLREKRYTADINTFAATISVNFGGKPRRGKR